MIMIERILGWVGALFKGAVSHEYYFPMKREPFQAVVRAVEKKSWIHSKKNLSELLDSIEDSFRLFSIPTSQHPLGTDRRTIDGIKTMGPVVPCYAVADSAFKDATKHKNDSGFVPIIDLDLVKKLSFMCMKNFSPAEEEKTDCFGTAEFVYATKLQKLPWYVEQKKGIAFEFGEGFAFSKDITWLRSYIVIDPKTGATAFCKTLRSTSVVQKPNNKTQIRYSKRTYDNPLVDETNKDKHGASKNSNNDANMRFDFWVLTHFWRLRDYEWTVSVRKDGQRVQFSVPHEMTKHFFKDRGKTVTVNGNTQPIIHSVKEHKRTLRSGKATTIREHIRGVRTFIWGGFSCAVSAPKFHAFARSTLPTGATCVEDDDPMAGMVSIDQVAKRLAIAEETNRRK